MDLSQYAELFLAESREHLGTCNQLLLEWERDPGARGPVDGLFRAFHTVKGMAGTMGYSVVADLAHRAESLLEPLRRDARRPTDALLDVLFRTVDALERAVELSAAGRERELDVAALVGELDQAAPRGATAAPERATATPTPERAPQDGRLVHVVLRPEAALKGGRALVALRKAERLGSVHSVSPPLTAFEVEDFDGRFTFRLVSEAPAAAIIAAVTSAGDVEQVTLSEDDEARPVGAALESAAGPARHIRVDLRRLDTLMNQIGELLTARGRLNELAAARHDPTLDDLASHIWRLSGELQEEIVEARMTPVWQVFDRFPRLVRDSARELGKQVALRVEGKEIELDRAILDEIGDPLVHLLRNAVDHGIEPPAERRAAGKKPEGEVVLVAVRERARVTITISDDGRGIDRTRVLAIAKRDGIVEPHTDTLTDDQLLRVLARPGFTTASAVTSVSGRGVGIDVALTRVRALGGTVEVRSELGKGTSFILRLPVTLAIVRALITSVGAERYALPLTYVSETVELSQAPRTTVEGRDAIVLRDRVVPLVPLRQLLDVAGDDAPARRPIIVLEMGERRAGVVVDAMLGQQEIVVKSFDAPQGMLGLFSGATIMSDGLPALILDAGELV